MDPIIKVSDREAMDKINRLRSSLVSGRIGRREFLVTALALSVSATAASSVFNTARAAAEEGRAGCARASPAAAPAMSWTRDSSWMPT